MQLVFSWVPKLAKSVRVNIGCPVVRTDGRRSVYGHVITKFSGMGRFTKLWGSAHEREARAWSSAMIIKLVARRVLLHVVLRLFHSLTSSFFFSGVYFTLSDPSNYYPETILLNTYDYTGRVTYSKRLWEKIDRVIEVEMDVNEVEKVFGVSNGDVYVYEGDVHLYNYQ